MEMLAVSNDCVVHLLWRRWHHALAYGGFLRTAPVEQQAPVSTVPPSSEPASSLKEEMLVSTSAPEGLGFDNAPTLSQRKNGSGSHLLQLLLLLVLLLS